MDLKQLYEKQISLTEWFEKIGHAQTEAMRLEDNEKRERLRVLNEHVGLPYDRPHQFTATDIAERTPAFVEFLSEHGGELCALRLIPTDAQLPKLRMRGMSVADVTRDWFPAQGIDPGKYRADFVPHPSDHVWSTIFVVNEHGVFGEIIRGSHNQLTQGFHDGNDPIVFSHDFSAWTLSPDDADAREYLVDTLRMLRVDDPSAQFALAQSLDARFVRNHLVGYFETVASSAFGTWFIDYNRLLADLAAASVPVETDDAILCGRTGSAGRARGRVRIVLAEHLDGATIDAGDILVCDMTTPDHLPLMRRAGAIVTDLGGILTHAAITCRELGKPCVVGTKSGTKVLAEGELVEVDADRGIIRLTRP